MTRPHDDPRAADLLELAVPYALHAISDAERERIETRVADAGLPVADAFYDEVRATRETMAVVSAASAAEPPADLRRRLLTAVAADSSQNVRSQNVRSLSGARSGRRWRGALNRFDNVVDLYSQPIYRDATDEILPCGADLTALPIYVVCRVSLTGYAVTCERVGHIVFDGRDWNDDTIRCAV